MTTNNPKAQADALIARGRALIEQGRLPEATDLLNQAVKLYWAAGDSYSAAAQTGNYGWALRRMGRADLARPYLEHAATIFDEIGLAEFAERHRFAANDVASVLDPAFLDSLPPAVRGALERGDGAALQFALDALPVAEQQIIYERLTAAGVISDADEEQAESAVQQFEPLLQAIAAVARGDESERADVEVALEDLERKGWRVRRPVEKIWAGERRPGPLLYGLDPSDTAMVQRVLEILES
ncbi:tetratricopeptide repeat protein [Oscillochloris sp. ZM17-4]|uniref:tetratricopeptide repeat protein n=1 Tax=Oscillochloris sp. ZM17-4 TaxID=2866714 RepID=UPI001C737E1B|nr:tetratricopeptide repeat protein [Oscillochloris sp. ZM17-4]MBX0330239.1 tetratricopeptide repeat protein [Oscillochloris sp. ZM17-4]